MFAPPWGAPGAYYAWASMHRACGAQHAISPAAVRVTAGTAGQGPEEEEEDEEGELLHAHDGAPDYEEELIAERSAAMEGPGAPLFRQALLLQQQGELPAAEVMLREAIAAAREAEAEAPGPALEDGAQWGPAVARGARLATLLRCGGREAAQREAAALFRAALSARTRAAGLSDLLRAHYAEEVACMCAAPLVKHTCAAPWWNWNDLACRSFPLCPCACMHAIYACAGPLARAAPKARAPCAQDARHRRVPGGGHPA